MDSVGRVEDLLARMTLEEQAAQMVMALNAPGAAKTGSREPVIAPHEVGSLLTFLNGEADAAEAAAANNRLQEAAARTRLAVPLLIGGDFDQGLASQVVGGVTDFPTQMGIAAVSDEDAAEREAYIAGREARALGFHWTSMPCADVNTNPANPVIGVRSFGDDPAVVARLTAAQVRGYERAGVLGTVKHFPGHGAARVDSHLGLPRITASWTEMEHIHLPPFVSAIEAGSPAVMTAHIVFDALDPELPATLSHRVLTGLLRDDLGFDGIIVTDLMSMRAIAVRWDPGEAAVLAVRAGADIVMAAGSDEDARLTLQALVNDAQSDPAFRARVEQSARRVLYSKAALGLFDGAQVDLSSISEQAGTPEALSLSDHIAARSITLLKNDGALPFTGEGEASTLIAGITHLSRSGRPPVTHVPLVADMVAERTPGRVRTWIAGSDDPTDAEIAEAVSAAESAGRIIVLTYSRGELPSGQARLVGALNEIGKPLVAVATGTPYDAASYPQVRAALATYALNFVPRMLTSPRVLSAAIEVIFGKEAVGRLPVRLPQFDAGCHS